MNTRSLVVETSLNRAEFRWKFLRLLQQSAVLGISLCLLILTFGVAILAGWISNKDVALTFLALVGGVGLISWGIILIRVAVQEPDRRWLAASVERVDRRLLDRLNTLLFLESRPKAPPTEAFATRIAGQAQTVLAQKAPPSPFSARRSLTYLLAFLVALTATVVLYQRYSPWRLLTAPPRLKAARPALPQQPLELALAATNSLEQHQAWGEVRITDPGADLKVTKVDVVPLQIEAAANQPLAAVNWFSTINGTAEARHELPPPAEPRYATYRPSIYLDELNLSDWDVLTYYAKANTTKQNAYASEVYFL
ncbi:MAG TPA: hypothetical protein VNT26_23260, partial [Candidatus Sulfotelmatobacter sp.]|nr:hypothetical protein [Candidatus Sulfotelmatobacter sp.]